MKSSLIWFGLFVALSRQASAEPLEIEPAWDETGLKGVWGSNSTG